MARFSAVLVSTIVAFGVVVIASPIDRRTDSATPLDSPVSQVFNSSWSGICVLGNLRLVSGP